MSVSVEDFEITFDLPALTIEGLKPFQVRAANYLMSARQAINGMGRGLGKGVVILAVLDAKELFPVIYVAPANTKLKVAAEVLYWLKKRRTVSIIQGRKKEPEAIINSDKQESEYDLPLDEEVEQKSFLVKLKTGETVEVPVNDLTADVLIVNYHIAYDWANDLIQVKHKALVIDEAHRILDEESYFYKACFFMSRHTQAVKGHQHIYPMTGNFAVNYNKDLIPIIDTMGRLHEFGGKTKFKTRYCDLKKETVRVGGQDREIYNDKGSSNTRELFHHLRARCLFRTTMREEYPETADKKRIPITIPLSNRIEYDRAQNDIIKYVRQEVIGNYDFYQALAIASLSELLAKVPEDYAALVSAYPEVDQALMCRNYIRDNSVKNRAYRALKAKSLAERTKLRQLTGIGKILGIKEWIETFHLENPEKKLIVFAIHQPVQKALIKALPGCAKLIAGQGTQDRYNDMERFDKDPKCKDIVVSTGAGSEGSDLDAAEDVMHAELPYTSLALEQAEDRACRIRNLHPVTSWLAIAPNTTDSKLLEILQRKFDMALRIQDGIEAEALLSIPLEDSILDFMISDAVKGV